MDAFFARIKSLKASRRQRYQPLSARSHQSAQPQPSAAHPRTLEPNVSENSDAKSDNGQCNDQTDHTQSPFEVARQSALRTAATNDVPVASSLNELIRRLSVSGGPSDQLDLFSADNSNPASPRAPQLDPTLTPEYRQMVHAKAISIKKQLLGKTHSAEPSEWMGPAFTSGNDHA